MRSFVNLEPVEANLLRPHALHRYSLYAERGAAGFLNDVACFCGVVSVEDETPCLHILLVGARGGQPRRGENNAEKI